MTQGSTAALPGIGDVRIDRVVEALPTGFETMRSEALAEGYRFLERLATDWASGPLRFTKPGEMLLAASSDGVLAGIGGLTVDPVLPEALRMRRFYVRKAFRRFGIGQRLAAALLEQAIARGCPVTVNAAPGSAAFWESLGFLPDERDGHTHLLGVSPG
jgi:GNAT superfamily N-acetyltransferase